MKTHQFLRDRAWAFILEMQISTLPVDVFDLIKKLGYGLYTYEQLAERTNLTITEIAARYGNDSFCYWSKRQNGYVIVYNPNHNPQRIRWSLMHEIGHIYLGHVENDVVLCRDGIAIAEYEANGFARRVLCPSIVLHKTKSYEVAQITKLCDISRQAAQYRSNYIKQLRERGVFLTSPLEHKVYEQFKIFIEKGREFL